MERERFIWTRILGLAGACGIALALAAILWCCVCSPATLRASAGGPPKPASQSTALPIGVGAPLSGGAASLGWQIANAVQLAISQANAAGGVTVGGVTHTLWLLPADDGCSAGAAPSAAQTLVSAGVVGVVGHLCSGATMAAAPTYAAAGTTMISPASTGLGVTQQGYSTTFRTIPHDGATPALLARYLRVLGLLRVTMVDGGAGWNPEQTGVLSRALAGLGGTIVSHRAASDPSQFAALAGDIKQQDHPQAIVYFDTDPQRAGLFSQACYGVGMNDVPVAWAAQDNAEAQLATYAEAAGAAAAEEDIVALSFRRFGDMPGWPAFLAAYQAAGFPNAGDDPGIVGAFAYDAARILIAGLSRAGSPAPAAIRDQVAVTRGFVGVVGTYVRFDNFGDVVPQWAWLERYRSGTWNVQSVVDVHLPFMRR